MYCHCKELPFCCVSLEKKEDYICKYNVYKCNRLKSDGPKKKSCDFLKKDLVTKKKIIILNPYWNQLVSYMKETIDKNYLIILDCVNNLVQTKIITET